MKYVCRHAYTLFRIFLIKLDTHLMGYSTYVLFTINLHSFLNAAYLNAGMLAVRRIRIQSNTCEFCFNINNTINVLYDNNNISLSNISLMTVSKEVVNDSLFFHIYITEHKMLSPVELCHITFVDIIILYKINLSILF